MHWLWIVRCGVLLLHPPGRKRCKNKLLTFRGHSFNNLFYAAGATYHHLADIKTFFDCWSDPHELLKSISFGVNEKVYTSSLRALELVSKKIQVPS